MTSHGGSNNQPDTRIAWVEPEMIELNVTETANRPRFGRDGGVYADCLRS